MKIIKFLTVATFTLVFLASCGDSSGHFKDAQGQIDISVTCIANPTTTDIATYTTMLSGDVLVKGDNNATVTAYHDQTGIKKVCITSGSAYLIRE